MQKIPDYQIQGLKQGNKQVFEEIFNAWYEPLCRYCIQRMGSQEDAEEIVQDVFVKLWIKRQEIHINTSLKSYLYRMALNAIINYQEHLKVRLSHREHVISESRNTMNDLSLIGTKEIESLTALAISNMPKKRRMVYELSRSKGLTYAEIAENMNISVKTVEAHLSAALQNLRQYLKDYITIFVLAGFYYFF